VPRAKQKTLGKEVFAESEIKNSRHRKNTRHRGFFAENQIKNSQQRKKLGKDFFAKSKFFGSRQRNFKKSLFYLQFFLSSTYTYIKLMLKFGTILTLFAIFNNFTYF
jgi:hypothetical protein